MRIPFGKYRGRELSDVPENYLCWIIDNFERESWRQVAANELRRRALRASEPPPSRALGVIDGITRELIEAGFKVLAKKFHPDCGGSKEKMQQLNATMERLRG